MFFCILAKITGSVIGILSVWLFPAATLLQGALLGILPIWLEVLASTLKRVEPAREQRQAWKLADLIADACSFVLVPCAWLLMSADGSVMILTGVSLFFCAGLYRLMRFYKTGLIGGTFLGLPVTYTGYIWVVEIFLVQRNNHIIILITLALAAWLMTTRRVRIKPSQ
jgi:hypothetical protein